MLKYFDYSKSNRKSALTFEIGAHMSHFYYDNSIEEELNMLGYKDGSQEVYVTIDSVSPFRGQRIQPRRDDWNYSKRQGGDGEEGFLVRFSLMNEEMLQMNQEALASLDRVGPHFQYRPYYYVFETFVPSLDGLPTQLCDSLLHVCGLSCEKLMRIGKEVSMGSESGYWKGVLSPAFSSELPLSNDAGFVSLIGLLGYSGERGYDYVQLKIWLQGLQGEAAKKVNLQARQALSGIVSDSWTKALYESLAFGHLCHVGYRGPIARVYYVGQANATCIAAATPHPKGGQSLRNPGIYFDLGRPIGYIAGKMTEDDKKEVDENLALIGGMDLDMIVVSHWHQDHYDGAIRLLSMGKSPFDPTFWILPNADFPNGALSLIIYLLVNKRPMICADANSLPLGNGVISLYAGSGKTINDSGVLLKVKDTVFAGDCDYGYWPKSLLSGCGSLKNLIVPHHGSAKYAISGLKKALGGSSSPKCAYISVGKTLANGNKPYGSRYHSGHPSADHIADLQSLGFNVECTKDLPATANWRYYKINDL